MRSIRHSLRSLSALLVLAQASAANADTKRVELTPTADASVQGSCVGYNAYTWPSSDLLITTKAAIHCYGADSFIAFDLAPLAGINPATITSATLELLQYDSGTNYGWPWYDYRVAAYPATSPWTERNGVWGAYPTFDGSARYENRINIDQTNQWRRWDVTRAVGDWLAGSLVNRGFRLNVLDEGQFSDLTVLYRSREASDPTQRPRLVVQYVVESDSDDDGAVDSADGCPLDPRKLAAGTCGCGESDADSDLDRAADCVDACPADSFKQEIGVCGCGRGDDDRDGDGVADCLDVCDSDPQKVEPGTCGCSRPDVDGDHDGALDCLDLCAADPAKRDPGACGCGVADTDQDGDGLADCVDACSADPENDADGDLVCGDVDNCALVANSMQSDGDADGVGDACDNCPVTVNPDQLDLDNNGIGEACDDFAPPTVMIHAPSLTRESQAELRIATFDDGSGVRMVRIDNGGHVLEIPSTGGELVVPVPLAEGRNEFIVTAFDARGNRAASSATIVRDSTAPVLTITSPSNGMAIATTAILVSGLVDDASATQISIVDGAGQSVLAGGGGFQGMTSLPDVEGVHTIKVVATDEAGNQAVASIDVLLDRSAPIITTDFADAVLGPQADDLVLVTLHIDDAVASVATSGTQQFSLARGGGVVQLALPLVSGSNVLELTVVNELGLATTWRHTVEYDVTPPEGLLASPSGDVWVRGVVELVVEARDASTTVTAVTDQIDANPSISATHASGDLWTATLDTSSLSDGTHAWNAIARDAVGNTRAVSGTLRVDNGGPVAAFAAPSAGAVVRGTVRIEATASDATSGIAFLRLEAAGNVVATCNAATSCSASLDTTALPNGPFTISASAVDAAGNVSPVSQRAIVVDNEAPSRFLVKPTSGVVVAGSTTVEVAVTDADFASVQCFVAGRSLGVSANRNFKQTVSLLDLLDGAVLVHCVATDTTGNTGVESVNVTLANWREQFNPDVLNLKANGKRVMMRVAGANVQLLLAHAQSLAIAVPGGTRIPAIAVRSCGQGGRDEDDAECTGADASKVLVKFDRQTFAASVRAAIAAGSVDANRLVDVRLFAGDRLLGAHAVRVKD
jgi:hypothetical protein